MSDLNKKLAFITGAGRGIGAATAKRFAQEGMNLALVSRSAQQLRELKKGIQQDFKDLEILCLPADISKQNEILKVFEEITNHFGSLDVLVNNAGVIWVKDFEKMSVQEWDETMAVNLRALFFTCQKAIPLMKKAGAGSIINISSLAGIQGLQKFRGFSAYTASKMGVVGLTEVLSEELKEEGIRVNCVAPGAVDTQMLRTALPGLKTSTKPEDIAEEILYFADTASCQGATGVIKELRNVPA